MSKQRFYAAVEIAHDPELAELLLARSEALLAIEEQVAALRASKADLFDDMRDDRLDPSFAKAFVAEKLRDPEREEKARLAAEDRRIVLDALADAETKQGRARARAHTMAQSVPTHPEMDRDVGLGNADGPVPAESNPEGDRREPVRDASHAEPGESPGAISPDAASGGYSADPDAQEDSVSRTGRRNGEVAWGGAAVVAEPGRNPGQPHSLEPAPPSEAATEVRHDVARDASGAGHIGEPAPTQRRELCDHPKRPLAPGGVNWTHFRDSQSWPDDEVQARYQAFVPRTVGQIQAGIGGGA